MAIILNNCLPQVGSR
uniref:Uncharacterized protein n=1 Tax=Anguilla anguilla TaxID=7936 RepID=A0A0E9VTZ2_ANGAN